MLHSYLPHFVSSVILVSLPSPLSDIFVDANAPNCASGTGTVVSPVCTIGAAVGLASSGDTIRIAPGTYVENVVIEIDLELVGTGGAAVTTIDGNASGRVVTAQAVVTLDGLTITNGLEEFGAGVGGWGSLVLKNSTIIGNTASGYYARGAGVGVGTGSSVTIDRCTIRDNQATYSGTSYYMGAGGVHSRFGSLTILKSTIAGNTSEGSAGGIVLGDGLLKISNTTISDNASAGTGGINTYRLDAGSVLSGVTITANTGPQAGGVSGSASPPQFSSPLEVRNCIIAGNTNPTSPRAADHSAYFVSLGHNVIGVGNFPNPFPEVPGDQVGNLAGPLNPMLGPLTDNGGPTQTHALLPGSPAIDAGDPVHFDPRDQRGIARPLGGNPDIGALESAGTTGIFVDLCTGDGGNQVGCTSCPCSNEALQGSLGGCLNSAAASARLLADGDPSVSLPIMSTSDLRFSASGIPALALGLLSSGDSVAPANTANPCFGLSSGSQSAVLDGLRCAIVNTRRHGGRIADGNGSIGTTNDPWGGAGAPTAGLAQAFGGFTPGQTRFFQVLYRDNPLAGCMRGLNTSQAIRVTFTP